MQLLQTELSQKDDQLKSKIKLQVSYIGGK